MNREKLNYKNGKIYKLVDIRDNESVYIGSTCQELSQRMTTHRSAARGAPKKSEVLGKPMMVHLHMYDNGVENFRIVLLEKWPCGSRAELEAREHHWIGNEKPKLNVKGIAQPNPSITCFCGHTITAKGYKKHFFSHKHEQAVENDSEMCMRYLFEAYPSHVTLKIPV